MTELFGRLHPVLIHLPIGFLVLLTTLELLALGKRFKHLASASRAIITLTVPAAALSAVCGWLLSLSGGYDENIIGWHKWLGVSVACLSVILLFFHWRGWVWAYRGLLSTTFFLLIVTAHFGGQLTHGENYLRAPFQKWLGLKSSKSGNTSPSAADTMSQSVYTAAIQPVLNNNCISCHGEKKSKGKLRLDTAENIMRGGDSGDVIVPNNASVSLLIKRIMLPTDNEDHMPPEGKHQLSADEIALLRWWVDVGAPTNKTIGELDPPTEILKLANAKIEKPK